MDVARRRAELAPAGAAWEMTSRPEKRAYRNAHGQIVGYDRNKRLRKSDHTFDNIVAACVKLVDDAPWHPEILRRCGLPDLVLPIVNVRCIMLAYKHNLKKKRSHAHREGRYGLVYSRNPVRQPTAPVRSIPTTPGALIQSPGTTCPTT